MRSAYCRSVHGDALKPRTGGELAAVDGHREAFAPLPADRDVVSAIAQVFQDEIVPRRREERIDREALRTSAIAFCGRHEKYIVYGAGPSVTTFTSKHVPSFSLPRTGFSA